MDILIDFQERNILKRSSSCHLPIPIWDIHDVRKYVNNLIKQHPDPVYQAIFEKNIDLIVGATK